MLGLPNMDEVLRHIEPGAVATFLRSQGYVPDGISNKTISIFVCTRGDMILLPLDQSARDYAIRLRDIIELFVDENTPPDDVVGKIVLPHSDIMRYRIDSPESAWGHLRLSYSHEAMGGLYNLLQFTAAGVSTQKLDYRRVSDHAQLFARQCRFGQTEYGSFVIKVFCPVSPLRLMEETDEPFGRQTTRAVLENLAFLSSEKSEDPEEPMPPTMNRQVATSVQRLEPQGRFGVQTQVAMRFTSRVEPDAIEHSKTAERPVDSIKSLNLGPFIFSRARSVGDRLKKAEEFRRELLTGHIETLHKDRPREESEQSHEVLLDVKYGTSRRKLRVRLLPRQYKNAMIWHDTNREVDVDAVIDTRGKVWSVYQLNSFGVVPRRGEEATLFGEP